MTLTAPPPKLERTLESCEAAAEELSALGVARAHTTPEPLKVKSIRRRRLGRLTYEKLKFDHEPELPHSLAAVGLGGPATAVAHLCRTGDDRRPWLVWVHGAGQGQPIDLLFSRARRIRDELGFNIALPVQPGHGSRRTRRGGPSRSPLVSVASTWRSTPRRPSPSQVCSVSISPWPPRPSVGRSSPPCGCSSCGRRRADW